uniref:BLOC-1-related complex subunit 5-like n=1 Tax=Styela clava TaxID=7725 RepID=UPI00193A625C|nr:BLOC-1-related complex subunit 5-like [Styela clava]
MGNEQSASQTAPQSVKASQRTAESQRASTKTSGIVVVGTKEPELSGNYLDNYITRLDTCPSFQPIFQSQGSGEGRPQQGELVGQLDWKAALKVSTRIQEHLHKCAEAVSSDQNSLASQIKQVDAQACQIMQKYTERQKAFAKYAEHMRKIDEISSSLKRVRMNLDTTFNLLDELNKYLPDEERIDIK